MISLSLTFPAFVICFEQPVVKENHCRQCDCRLLLQYRHNVKAERGAQPPSSPGGQTTLATPDETKKRRQEKDCQEWLGYPRDTGHCFFIHGIKSQKRWSSPG